MSTSTGKQFACNFERIIQLYSRLGSVVQTMWMDTEFNKVVPEVPGIVINTSVAKEHVVEVDCWIM